MKTKFLGNAFLVSAIAILFLAPSFSPVKAQGAGCGCVCTNTQIGSVADEAACRQECTDANDTFESCVPEAQPQNQNNQQNAGGGGGVQQLPNPLGTTDVSELIAR